MRKQILSGFMMFALVAGSLAPAGEVHAEEFQVVDSDNAPVYNEAKDQFETKVELTGINAGKFRFQKMTEETGWKRLKTVLFLV